MKILLQFLCRAILVSIYSIRYRAWLALQSENMNEKTKIKASAGVQKIVADVKKLDEDFNDWKIKKNIATMTFTELVTEYRKTVQKAKDTTDQDDKDLLLSNALKYSKELRRIESSLPRFTGSCDSSPLINT